MVLIVKKRVRVSLAMVRDIQEKLSENRSLFVIRKSVPAD
jgi:hypothetical protein